MTWYVVQAKPGGEGKAAANLKAMGYAVFLPRHWETTSTGTRTTTTLKPMLTSYLFAAVDPGKAQSVYAINSTIGVRRVVVIGGKSVTISEDDLWDFRRFFDPDGVMPPNPRSLKHLLKVIRLKIAPKIPGLGVHELLARIERLDDRGTFRVQGGETGDWGDDQQARTWSEKVPETAENRQSMGTPQAAAMSKIRETSDARSERAEAYRPWYWTPRWRRISKAQLAAEPLCRMCVKQGRVTPARVCDHVEPHNGDPAKFWGGPFQSLCKSHHDQAKQQIEACGYSSEVDANGIPIDPSHPFHGGRGGVNP